MRKKRFIIPGLILLVIVLAFKYVLFIGYVPSESMEPMLKAGSYIIGQIWSDMVLCITIITHLTPI